MSDEYLSLLDPEDRLAAANILAQEALVKSLKQAREVAGLSMEEVAERLGATVEIVQGVESGEYDLTLSELRRYAFAVDAFIEYEVDSFSDDEDNPQEG